MALLKSMLVYCGARNTVDPIYLKAGKEFGKCMLDAKIDLIYGSGNSGLMGCVAQTVSEGGGKVTGIIPKHLYETHKLQKGFGETIVLETMHERKALMVEKADVCVALPGGIGTMEELMEVMTWNGLGIISKPIGILNINGYYDLMLKWIEHAFKEGFIRQEPIQLFVVDSDPKQLIQKMIERYNSKEQ